MDEDIQNHMLYSSSFKKMIIEENDSFLLHFPIGLIGFNILPSSVLRILNQRFGGTLLSKSKDHFIRTK